MNKKYDNEKIDFVLTWVDGNDEKWQKEKIKYSNNPNASANTISRYRDWDLLRYWFRGVEKFAPWVNNVFFITCGHYPEWLNINHPKLKFIKHEDYMPKEYLPTFSSHPIELNFHRIKNLSERFVYFNDDFYIIKDVERTDFFENSKPKYIACCDIISSEKYDNTFPHILLNNISIMNKYYDKKEVMKKYFFKWFSLKYGLKLLSKNLFMYSFNNFSNIFEPHVAVPLLKSTLEEMWQKEKIILDKTSSNKFRGIEDVNQYIFKWYDIGRGNFIASPVIGMYFDIYGQKELLLKEIEKPKHKLICFGDDERIDFEKTKQEIEIVFKKLLPDKCDFEL